MLINVFTDHSWALLHFYYCLRLFFIQFFDIFLFLQVLWSFLQFWLLSLWRLYSDLRLTAGKQPNLKIPGFYIEQFSHSDLPYFALLFQSTLGLICCMLPLLNQSLFVAIHSLGSKFQFLKTIDFWFNLGKLKREHFSVEHWFVITFLSRFVSWSDAERIVWFYVLIFSSKKICWVEVAAYFQELARL